MPSSCRLSVNNFAVIKNVAVLLVAASMWQFGSAQEAVTLQPITALHSIVARQPVYEANVNGQLAATCDVCEQPGANVSVYWGRDDSTSGVPAFVIGGKIKYPRWTSMPAQVIPGVSCGSNGNANGVRYVVSLTAESLTVGDSGRWWCQLLPNEKSADWRFSYFSINVYGALSAATDVSLKANDSALPTASPSINVIEGAKTTLACEVSPSRLNKNQNVTVNWQIEGQANFLAEDQPVFDYVAHIDHFGKQILCVVEYFGAPPSGKAPPVIRRIGLNIILRPRASISAWGPAGVSVTSDGAAEQPSSSMARSLLVDEGQTIELQCSAFNSILHNSRALTGREQFRWFLVEPSAVPDGTPTELVHGRGKRTLTMGPMDRNRDGSIIRCDVDNGYLTSSTQMRFSVQYKLASSADATFIGAVVGETVTLDCTAGDLEADRFVASYQFVWFFGRLQIVMPSTLAADEESRKAGNVGQILSFRLTNSSQFGNYRCLAKNVRSGSQAARNFFILEKSKPQASSSLAVVDAIPRYSASIRCSTFGLPRPSTFRWFRHNASDAANNELFDDNAKFEIVQRNATSAITESTLVIREVADADFGRYVCTAANEFGSVESAYLLTRKDSFPTIEIVAGACAGAFILIILVAVAIYFKCRRIKGNESGANSLKLSETASSGSGGHDGASSSSSSSASDRDRRRDSITSPTYTVDVGDKSSPGATIATIGTHPHLMGHHPHPHLHHLNSSSNSHHLNNNSQQPQLHLHHHHNNNSNNNIGGTFGSSNNVMAQSLTLPSLPNLLPSYHRYPESSMVDSLVAGANGQNAGLVRLSTSVNDNFDDWLKQSRLATFSHLGAYQPSVSFRHPLPPIPVAAAAAVAGAATSSATSSLAPTPAITEASRLATDV